MQLALQTQPTLLNRLKSGLGLHPETIKPDLIGVKGENELNKKAGERTSPAFILR